MNVIDIIVPVYAGLDATQTCLESVLHAGFSPQANLHIIYDCGPDPEVESYLETVTAKHPGIYLHRNKANLGFVKSVNRGLRLNPDRDVIILNSDTQVFGDWIDRLLLVAHSDQRIATATPFSNNAEICSFPKICVDNPIPPYIALSWVDRQCAKLPLRDVEELPTGVGYCMWIRRTALREVGMFDEERFGRGYGEENDLCRRFVRAHYKNVLAHNVFVFHKGGVSFGPDKARLVDSAIARVEAKHPGYIRTVHDFIRRDPARAHRLRVMLEILRASSRPTVLAITHNLAGGTKQYLDDLIAIKAQHFDVLLLQPVSDHDVRLSLPAWMGESLSFRLDDQYDLLIAVLKDIGLNLIFLNHIRGNEHYAARLIEALGLEVWCVLHDYYFIAGNPTLTDETGRFVAPSTHADASNAQDSRAPNTMSPAEWSLNVHLPLLNAVKAIAPSVSVRELYNVYFPTLDIEVHPHRDQEQRSGYTDVRIKPGRCTRNIVVIGALNKEKGADLLEEVAELARLNHVDLEFHLIGYAYRPLASSVRTSGPYRETELSGLLRNLDPVLVWYPCQWPETYSYTLSRVLELGYPLLIPNLGALKDRTLNRPLTRRVDHPQSPLRWLEVIADFVRELNSDATQAAGWMAGAEYPPFYTSPWRLPDKRQHRTTGIEAEVVACLTPIVSEPPRGETVLRVLFALRQLPFIRNLAARIPIPWQRKVKRLLTSKPVHDVML